MTKEFFNFATQDFARHTKKDIDDVCNSISWRMDRVDDYVPFHVVAVSRIGTVYHYEINAGKVECNEMRPYSPAEREADCAAQSALLRLSYLARSGKDRYISDEVDDLVAKLRNRI